MDAKCNTVQYNAAQHKMRLRGIVLKGIFFYYYRDSIYNLYQDMCTYRQLKNKNNNIMCNPPPPPQGVNGAPYVQKLCASSGIDISKCIEGESMKFTILVDDIIYMCVQSRMHFRVINVLFF